MKNFPFILVAILFFTSVGVAASENIFTVQVTAQKNLRTTNQIVLDLKGKGLSAFYTRLQVAGKGSVYRINVGHLRTLAQAQAFRKKLISKYAISSKAFVRQLNSENEGEVPTPVPTPEATPALAPPTPKPTPEATPEATPTITKPEPEPMATPTPPSQTSLSPQSPWAVLTGSVISFTNYSVQFPSSYVGTGVSNSLTSSPLAGFGFAILPSLRLTTNFNLESGIMLFQRTFNVSYNNGLGAEPGSESYTALEIPLLIYYRILNRLQIGLGGFIIVNPAGSMTQSTFGGPTMPDSNLSGNDWGLTAALGYSFAIGSQTDLVFSGRYDCGSGNLVSVGSNPMQVFSDYQILAGLRFHL